MNDLFRMSAVQADSTAPCALHDQNRTQDPSESRSRLSDTHRRWLLLVNSRGFGPVKLALAAEMIQKGLVLPGNAFQSCGQATALSPAECARVRRCMTGSEVADTLTAETIEVVSSWLDSAADHSLMTLLDHDYPPLLKQLKNPPPVLYLKGERDLLAFPQIAIVGSRRASRQGLHVAKAFAKELSAHGFIVTSGLALGIDTAAHQGSADTRTIAVLGCGTDVFYPPANKPLQMAIAHNGLLVSEFLPGTQPAPHHFPKRNRIIAGLCLGTLVVEAGVRSGSLHTALAALDLGREVMAIPGSIYSTESRGCHSLIKQGAALVETARDIVQRLAGAFETYRVLHGLEHQPDWVETASAGSNSLTHEGMDQQVLNALSAPKDLDELVADTGLDVSELMQTLLSLELDDVVIQDGGRYQRTEFQLK
ncbi:DNA-processing protein DprA [Allohahella marinimesophila]|uniref:DNA-processing protein DprA n=1 Tax=Allohahella marinimesophila TaxID=1054972 RepID=A0ABP7PCB3_9GAMM